MLYLWLKALHVIAAVFFVSGVLATALMLSLLHDLGAGAIDRLRVFNRRAVTPAMLAVWGLGLVLAQEGGWFASGWLRAKLVLVLALSAVHAVQSGLLRRLAEGSCSVPFYVPWARVLGTLPILALVAAIGILAVVKPG